MEKWKVLAGIGILLLIAAAYMLYATPKIKFVEVVSDLSVLQKATAVNVVAANFTTTQGHLTFEITPVNGYLINATIIVSTDEPDATLDVFSSVPVKVTTTGYNNATIFLPPALKDKVTFDIIFTFSNTTITHPVNIIVKDSICNIQNSTTIYANPG